MTTVSTDAPASATAADAAREVVFPDGTREPLHPAFGRDAHGINVEIDGCFACTADERLTCDSCADGSGRPGIGRIAGAIDVWATQQDLATVGEAAAVFRLPPGAVAQAVRWHRSLRLVGPASGALAAHVIDPV